MACLINGPDPHLFNAILQSTGLSQEHLYALQQSYGPAVFPATQEHALHLERNLWRMIETATEDRMAGFRCALRAPLPAYGSGDVASAAFATLRLVSQLFTSLRMSLSIENNTAFFGFHSLHPALDRHQLDLAMVFSYRALRVVAEFGGTNAVPADAVSPYVFVVLPPPDYDPEKGCDFTEMLSVCIPIPSDYRDAMLEAAHLDAESLVENVVQQAVDNGYAPEEILHLLPSEESGSGEPEPLPSEPLPPLGTHFL